MLVTYILALPCFIIPTQDDDNDNNGKKKKGKEIYLLE